MNKKFALIGIAGYIAPRHLKAIQAVGGELVAAYDIADSVGILDAYFPNCAFFTDEFAFYDFILDNCPIDYLVVCSPNFLHEQHCYAGLKLNADIICEKPLCLTLESWTNLKEAEAYSDKRIYTILQLRHHPKLIELKANIQADTHYDVLVDYHTPRGKWYHQSWKGDVQKSGGIATNIGIHLFDLVCWLFGDVKTIETQENTNTISTGIVTFENAKVQWNLDISPTQTPRRSIHINGKAIEFTAGFSDLHTTAYEHILNQKGFNLEYVLPSISIVEQIRKFESASSL